MAGQFQSLVPYATQTIQDNNALARIVATNPAYTDAAIRQAAINNDSGSVLGTQTDAARQAAAVEASRVAALRNSVNLGQDNAVATGQSGVNSYADSYRLQNQGVVNSFRNATRNYDSSRENAALNLRRGISGVTQGVRQGLQGAMASLPDSALDSGATPALGRSWNKYGQQQAGGVYNENALTLRGVDRDYEQAQFERDQALGNLGVDRNSKVEAISNQLYNDLRSLDISAQGQGLNGAVNYGLRDNLINNAIARLNALDQERGNELGGIRALGRDQVMANAVQLDAAGAQAYDPYSLPDIQGAVAVDSAAPVANIPFYTRRRDLM